MEHYLVYNLVYDLVELLAVYDNEEDAKRYVNKAGSGTIEKVESVEFDDHTEWYYSGSFNEKNNSFYCRGECERNEHYEIDSVRKHVYGTICNHYFNNIVAKSPSEAKTKFMELIK